MRLTWGTIREMLCEGPFDTYDELCDELWSVLEDRFGNVRSNQSKLIKRPNRMFFTLLEREKKEAMALVSRVTWMVTGERPTYHKRYRQDDMRTYETSTIEVSMRTYKRPGDEQITADVIVALKQTSECALKESIDVDEYEQLCSEIQDTLVAEFGEDHVDVERADAHWPTGGPGVQPLAITIVLSPEHPWKVAAFASKKVTRMLKTTFHTVTGVMPSDTHHTNFKMFEGAEIGVSIAIWDEETLRIVVMPRYRDT